MKKIIAISLLVLLLTGCAVQEKNQKSPENISPKNTETQINEKETTTEVAEPSSNKEIKPETKKEPSKEVPKTTPVEVKAVEPTAVKPQVVEPPVIEPVKTIEPVVDENQPCEPTDELNQQTLIKQVSDNFGNMTNEDYLKAIVTANGKYTLEGCNLSSDVRSDLNGKFSKSVLKVGDSLTIKPHALFLLLSDNQDFGILGAFNVKILPLVGRFYPFVVYPIKS